MTWQNILPHVIRYYVHMVCTFHSKFDLHVKNMTMVKINIILKILSTFNEYVCQYSFEPSCFQAHKIIILIKGGGDRTKGNHLYVYIVKCLMFQKKTVMANENDSFPQPKTKLWVHFQLINKKDEYTPILICALETKELSCI
jgi:hypothetical protein